MQEGNTLGERLASVRKRRGLTQRELATASGLSVSLIKKLEQGERSDVRIETARKIAEALRVPTTMLISRRGDGDEAYQDIAETWEPVRRALVGQVPLSDEQATPGGVREALTELAPALTSHHYTIVRNVLPALLRDADALDDDEREGQRIRADILTTTGYLLTQTRQFAIAELTLLRAIDAAGDKLSAAAAADVLVWLYLRQGRLAEARETAVQWADDIEPRFSRATVHELILWGRFLLDITNAAVRDNRLGEAQDALQLAAAAAARIGREVQLHPHSQGVFGPVTVAYIRAESRVLIDQPDRCLAIAESLPRQPPYPELVSRLRHRLDVANALAQTRRYPEAIAAIREIQIRAPEWLMEQRYARDILGEIIQRRRTLTPDMRELADAVRLPL